MFNSKQKQLFEKVTKETPAFVIAGLGIGAVTRSGNNAKKFAYTDNDFLNQFNALGIYRNPRAFSDIEKDMSILWSTDAELAIRFVFFLRAITRKVMLPDGNVMDSVTRGGGLKHESIMRYMWIHSRDKKLFFDNLLLFISVGSWRDVFDMLRYDLEYHGWKGRVLDWNALFEIIAFGLANENHTNLVKKYIPQITARSKCTTTREQANTIIGKWIMSRLKLNYKQYRLLKSSGTAHQWQQLISKQLFHKIDFAKIHGRALAKLVSGKFLENQGLVKKYEAWIESQPIAKYTGFPHELFANGVPDKEYKRRTLDAQFIGLVTANIDNTTTRGTELIVVRDTSASMRSQAMGTNMSSGNIAKALALYFSYFLKGKFAGTWIEFNKNATLHKWLGNTPTECWLNDKASFIGSTNFVGVAKLLVDIKETGVQESEFPKGILCISDGEFNNPSNRYTDVTNFIAFKQILINGGFSKEFVDEFKIVLWDIPNGYYRAGGNINFETYSSQIRNIFYFSGYSPSTIAFLTGTDYKESEKKAPQTAAELVEAALSQPIMEYIQM